MKCKLPFFLFIGAGTLFVLGIIDAMAAQREMPFFIPQKVLDQMNQPEKLPPIESLIIRNQSGSAPSKTQQNTRAEDAQKRQEQAAEQKRLAEQKLAQEKRIQAERQKQEELQKEQVRQKQLERIKKAEQQQTPQKEHKQQQASPEVVSGADKTPPQIEIPHDNHTDIPSENAATETRAPQKTAENSATKETKPSIPTPNVSSDFSKPAEIHTFDDIIADYKRDALDISRGKSVNNQRLRDILKDYDNKQRIL